MTARRPYTVDLSALRQYLSAVVAVSTGAWDDAAAAFLEGAERTGVRTRSASSPATSSGAASALCYGGRFADAVPVATEGTRRRPRARHADGIINECLVALAQALSRQDPERARALLDEAAHQDLDYEAYSELIQMTLAAAMIGDWPLTARFATRSIPHAHWMNHRPYLHGVLTVSARALADTDPEAAATIQGAAHALIAIRPPRPRRHDRRRPAAPARRSREPRRPDRRDPPRDHPPPRRSTRRRTTPRAPRPRRRHGHRHRRRLHPLPPRRVPHQRRRLNPSVRGEGGILVQLITVRLSLTQDMNSE